MMNFTITAYSTALFSTWIFIEELGLLFDAGDGVSAALLHKSRKIKHVFISHADRDHLTGLLQLNQLNAREDHPKVYYPKDCGSFPPLETFSKLFDPHVAATQWFGIESEKSFPIKTGYSVESIRNGHVAASSTQHKSLSYQVFQHKKKLKEEFQHLSGKEIGQLVATRGKDAVNISLKIPVLAYSGDSPVEDFDRWKYCKTLIHEATFLEATTPKGQIIPHGNKHSYLEEVIEMLSYSEVEQAILTHFSSRYDAEIIDRQIKTLCDKYAVNLPIYRVLPGQIHRNILSEAPINK